MRDVTYKLAALIFPQNGDVLVEVTCSSHYRHTTHECPPVLRSLYLSVAFRSSAMHLNHRRHVER